MHTIRTIAKAITAAVTAGLGAAAAANLTLHPAVLIAAAALVAGLAVFIVPNEE